MEVKLVEAIRAEAMPTERKEGTGGPRSYGTMQSQGMHSDLQSDDRLPPPGSPFPLRVFKFGGRLHRCWGTTLLAALPPSPGGPAGPGGGQTGRQPAPFGILALFEDPSHRVVEADGRVWSPRSPAVTLLWPDRWYTLSIMPRQGGGLRTYANLCTPPRLVSLVSGDCPPGVAAGQGAEIAGKVATVPGAEIVDLDLDVVTGFDPELAPWQPARLDQEEFEENRRRLAYPADLVARALATAAEVEELVLRREGPYRPELTSRLQSWFEEGAPPHRLSWLEGLRNLG